MEDTVRNIVVVVVSELFVKKVHLIVKHLHTNQHDPLFVIAPTRIFILPHLVLHERVLMIHSLLHERKEYQIIIEVLVQSLIDNLILLITLTGIHHQILHKLSG